MKARKKPTLRAALSAFTEEQLKSAKVHYPFADGTTDTLEAKTVKATLDRQVLALRRIQGKEGGGRPSKAPADIKEMISLKFSEYWLNRSENYPLLQARAHARSWIVGELLSQGIPERSARRWVADVIGKKTPIPKKYPRK